MRLQRFQCLRFVALSLCSCSPGELRKPGLPTAPPPSDSLAAMMPRLEAMPELPLPSPRPSQLLSGCGRRAKVSEAYLAALERCTTKKRRQRLCRDCLGAPAERGAHRRCRSGGKQTSYRQQLCAPHRSAASQDRTTCRTDLAGRALETRPATAPLWTPVQTWACTSCRLRLPSESPRNTGRRQPLCGVPSVAEHVKTLTSYIEVPPRPCWSETSSSTSALASQNAANLVVSVTYVNPTVQAS